MYIHEYSSRTLFEKVDIYVLKVSCLISTVERSHFILPSRTSWYVSNRRYMYLVFAYPRASCSSCTSIICHITCIIELSSFLLHQTSLTDHIANGETTLTSLRTTRIETTVISPTGTNDTHVNTVLTHTTEHKEVYNTCTNCVCNVK